MNKAVSGLALGATSLITQESLPLPSCNSAYSLSTVIHTHLSQPTHGLQVTFTTTNKKSLLLEHVISVKESLIIFHYHTHVKS